MGTRRIYYDRQALLALRGPISVEELAQQRWDSDRIHLASLPWLPVATAAATRVRLGVKLRWDVPVFVPRTFRQREKQLSYGRATLGYQLYMAYVENYHQVDIVHPPHPNIARSKRGWDVEVRRWRRALHRWDPITEEERALARTLFPQAYADWLTYRERQRGEEEE